MRILFALMVVSFVALLWAVYAVTRHVRRSVPTVGDPAVPEDGALEPSAPTKEVPSVRRSA